MLCFVKKVLERITPHSSCDIQRMSIILEINELVREIYCLKAHRTSNVQSRFHETANEHCISSNYENTVKSM